MALLADLRVLYHLVLKPVRGENHAARMESFYSGQAEAYDDFRKRLLKGRAELYDQMQVPENGTWVEMGGGTGSNLEYLGDRIHQLKKVYVVDLADSLLDVATKRAIRAMLLKWVYLSEFLCIFKVLTTIRQYSFRAFVLVLAHTSM